MTIEGLTLMQTCDSYPEEYDVYGGTPAVQVGYMRLRFGTFTVSCPDELGEYVYTHTFSDRWQGEFWKDSDRELHLTQGCRAINQWLQAKESTEL